jgi:hypothetical protein
MRVEPAEIEMAARGGVTDVNHRSLLVLTNGAKAPADSLLSLLERPETRGPRSRGDSAKFISPKAASGNPQRAAIQPARLSARTGDPAARACHIVATLPS